MGLDTTHDCWHGAYSSFGRWRRALCNVAGYGDIDRREGFGGTEPWPTDDVLVELLNHSDCDGMLRAAICAPLADRLEELLPAMRRTDHDGYHGQKTQAFIDGLRRAAEAGEDVEFH